MTAIPIQVHFLFHRSSYYYKFDVLPSKPQRLYTHIHTHTIFQIVFVIKPLHIYIIVSWYMGSFLVAQMVKNLPAMQEGWSLGQEIPWRRKWQLTPVFSPGESHGQRSLAGYSPWSRKESDTTSLSLFIMYRIVQDHQEPIFISPPDVFWGSVHLDWCWSGSFSSWMSRLLHTLLSLLSCPHTHGFWSSSMACFSMNFWAMNWKPEGFLWLVSAQVLKIQEDSVWVKLRFYILHIPYLL